MNATMKIGLGLMALSLVLRVGEEFAWPPIKALPINDPMTLPLLAALGICVLLVPILLLVGVILLVVGAANKAK